MGDEGWAAPLSQRINAMMNRKSPDLTQEKRSSSPSREGAPGTTLDFGSRDEQPPQSTRHGYATKPPMLISHTSPGQAMPPAAGDAPSGNDIEQLKRYIDVALEIQLGQLEKRLLSHMSTHGSPSAGQRSPGLEPRTRLQSRSHPGQAEDFHLPNAAVNMPTVPEGQAEETPSYRAELAKHERELKTREKFMMKHSAKEIFGEKGGEAEDGSHPGPHTSPGMGISALQSCREQGVVIDPRGVFRTWWDMLSIILVIWIALFLPYRLAFDIGEQAALGVLDLFIDIFFIVDVGLNMITAYEDDGHLVTKHTLIIKHYCRTWLIFDLVSSFPFDWLIFWPPGGVIDSSSSASTMQLIRSVKVVKLLRLLRIARLFRYLSRFEDGFPLIGQLVGSISSNLVRLNKLVIVILVFCHWNGCFQFLLAQLDTPQYNETTGWPEDYPHGFHKDSWVVRLEIAELGPWQQWEWSFFTANLQMLAIAIGSVEPKRSIELWGYILSILLGAVLYAVFVAVLTAVVADMDTSARAYRSRIEMVNHYMQHSQLPRELRAKLRTYYQLCYPQRRAFDEDGILGEVSRPLKQEVCLHKCRSVLAALQLLDAGERGSGVEGLPGAISMELQRVVFVTGDYIIREGEETEGLFFVSSGLVELLNSADPNAPITTLGAGSMFGEMALLSQTGRATATVRVQTFCEGYHLSKTSFNKLIYVYPSFKEYLQSVARLRLQKNTKLSPERRKQRGSVLLQGLIDDLTQERSVRMQGRIDQGRHHHKGADRQVARLMNKLNVNSRASEAAGGLDDGQPTTKFNVRRATMQAATAIFGKMQGGASRMSSRMSSRVSMGNSSSAAWAEERESGPSAAAPGDAGFGSMEA